MNASERDDPLKTQRRFHCLCVHPSQNGELTACPSAAYFFLRDMIMQRSPESSIITAHFSNKEMKAPRCQGIYPKSPLVLSDRGRTRIQGSKAQRKLLLPLCCRVSDKEGSLLAERSGRASQRKRHLRLSLKDGTRMWPEVSNLFVLPTMCVIFPAVSHTHHDK